MRYASAIAIALLAPLAAWGNDGRADYLRQFDSNADGRISQSEYMACMGHGFTRMDRNGDGVLEAFELPGARGASITLKRRQTDLRRQFRRMDRNHDGYLNARELTAPPG